MRLSAAAAVFSVLILAGLSCGGGDPAETTDHAGTEAPPADTDTQEEPVRAADPSGLWSTTMGDMTIFIDENGSVTGEYPLGCIEGELDGEALHFTYDEGSLSGAGVFVFDDGFGSFTGFVDLEGTELVWNGSRN